MHFAIIGRNLPLALKELELITPTNISKISQNIITFDTNFPENLKKIGSLIKRGKILSEEELPNLLSETKILGIADKNKGINFKKQFNIKRFKEVQLFHTDKEVKNKGTELINIQGKWGKVTGYQNISIYEIIDFDKPSRSMQMGMMPAKLSHSMINIGLSNLDPQEEKQGILIIDPFAGSGTTGMVANHLGYDFILSDKDIFHLQRNIPWRRERKEATDGHMYYFQHDILNKIDLNILSKANPKQILVVSEGWLGPITNKNTTSEQIKKYQEDIITIYKAFLDTIKNISFKRPTTAVFTIPYYIHGENRVEEYLGEYTKKIGLQLNSISEIYKREGQSVGRKVLIIE